MNNWSSHFYILSTLYLKESIYLKRKGCYSKALPTLLKRKQTKEIYVKNDIGALVGVAMIW